MAEVKIALIDMDDSIADYRGTFLKDLEKIASPFEPEAKDLLARTDAGWIEARRHVITSQAGWFRNLPKLQLGWDVLEVMLEIGFKLVIASKGPNSKPMAWTEKLQWCQEHLGDKMFGINLTSDKGLLYGRVLMDDYPEYIDAWLKHRPRGIVIMPAHPENEYFSHPQVVRYDGTNIEQVRAALQAAYDRDEGEAP